jgi:hypothetical protein
MLITDHFVYIELHKTGCSYTKELLSKVTSSNCIDYGKHNPYYTVPNEILGNFESKIKVGNIRNPWDWYVSLWAFGCMQKGSLYCKVTKNNKTGSKQKRSIPFINFQGNYNWEELYSDTYNPKLFRKWLKLILMKKSIDIGEGYKSSYLSRFAGLLTYRYLNLYTYHIEKAIPEYRNFDEMVMHDKKNNFMDIIIRKNRLQTDLFENTDKLGININLLKQALIDSNFDKNDSNRKEYTWYYDDKSIHLVGEKEKLIIEKYGYCF